jgi:hypothetical protein
MKNVLQMNGPRPFMHVYVISPAAPLFLVHPSLPALRAVLIPAGFSARTARLGYDSTLQRGWEGEKAFGAVHPYTDERGWDNFAGSMCGKTQAFDSV